MISLFLYSFRGYRKLAKLQVSEKLYILWRVRDFLHRSTLCYIDWNSKQCQILSQPCDFTGPFSPFPRQSSKPRKIDEKWKTRNHLYNSKALKKRYRGLIKRIWPISQPNSSKLRKTSILHSLFSLKKSPVLTSQNEQLSETFVLTSSLFIAD